ncbi:Cytochrome c1 heme lyase [Microbotryomycetes sp. JL221]|nr:Cytochrome c1 heme lyase [Microbotryomycetes sp. JL221]
MSTPASACPVDHSTRERWLADQQDMDSNRLPPQHPTTRRRQHTDALSTEREVSSIPRWLPPSDGDSLAATTPSPPTNQSSADETACPARSTPVASSNNTTQQTKTTENWVYPSPQSFYNALQRKQRNPNAQDMNIVVPIHNAVNERVWQQVLDWERQALWQQGQDPEQCQSKLVSFIGKPQRLSPRARWKSLIGYTAPFDRHDWIVDRPIPSADPNEPPQSQRIRYVIDFYTGRGAAALNDPATKTRQNTQGAVDNFKPNLAFYIDCRPALDDWEGVKMRMTRWWNSWSTVTPQSSSTTTRS